MADRYRRARSFGMPSSHYLGIAAKYRDGHIYRVVPSWRGIELLSTRQNVLVRPVAWDDPWEHVVLGRGILAGSHRASHPHSAYAQCWTMDSYSDAMWKVYSRGSDVIRLRSTPSRLLKSFSKVAGNEASLGFFVGRVSYLREARLLKLMKKTALLSKDTNLRQFARTLLAKRRCFAHEREIRLLLIAADGSPSRAARYKYAIDPNQLIDQIMLHPRMPESLVTRLRREILATGYRGRVKRSLLYEAPFKNAS